MQGESVPQAETSATPIPAQGTPQHVSLALPRSKPLFTWVFLAVNIILFGAMTLAGGSENTDVLVRFGAKVNALIVTGEYWRLVTPMFLHVGLLHLAFNTYALYAIGPEVERLYGRVAFLALYLLAGIGGTLASFAFNNSISAGASTAIFGLIGALGFYFARYRNMFGAAGKRQLISIVNITVLNLLFGFFYPGIDNHGHIGGLVAGVAVAWALCPDYKVLRGWDGWPTGVVDGRPFRKRVLLLAPVVLALALGTAVAVRAQTDSFGVHMERGQTLTESGDWQGALVEFTAAARVQPTSAEAQLMLGYVLSQQDRYSDAAAAFERAVALQGDWPDARWNLALTYTFLERYPDARQQLQAYLALPITDSERADAEDFLAQLDAVSP